jgi:hypothetical protein
MLLQGKEIGTQLSFASLTNPGIHFVMLTPTPPSTEVLSQQLVSLILFLGLLFLFKWSFGVITNTQSQSKSLGDLTHINSMDPPEPHVEGPP